MIVSLPDKRHRTSQEVLHSPFRSAIRVDLQSLNFTGILRLRLFLLFRHCLRFLFAVNCLFCHVSKIHFPHLLSFSMDRRLNLRHLLSFFQYPPGKYYFPAKIIQRVTQHPTLPHHEKLFRTPLIKQEELLLLRRLV